MAVHGWGLAKAVATQVGFTRKGKGSCCQSPRVSERLWDSGKSHGERPPGGLGCPSQQKPGWELCPEPVT